LDGDDTPAKKNPLSDNVSKCDDNVAAHLLASLQSGQDGSGKRKKGRKKAAHFSLGESAS
jgi:hypothetical protein